MSSANYQRLYAGGPAPPPTVPPGTNGPAQGAAPYTSFEHEEAPFRTTDLLLLRPPQPLTLQQRLVRDPRTQLRLVLLMCCGFILLWLLLGAMTEVSVRQLEPAVYSPECFMPLGGGMIGLGGSMLMLNDSRCAQQIETYFSPRFGSYYSEVNRVATLAHDHFVSLSKFRPATQDQLVVFDIDETTLSNVAEWLRPTSWLWKSSATSPYPLQGAPAAANQPPQQHQTPIDQEEHEDAGKEVQEQNGENEHNSEEEEAEQGKEEDRMEGVSGARKLGDFQRGGASSPIFGSALSPTSYKGVTASDRPALLPVLELYKWLYAQNYSVAFITGRSEGARASTILNLLAAGYGQECMTDTDAQGHKHTLRTDLPCYVSLGLREEGDVRLASVYKPERRQALMDAGYTLVGNLGDQFSDLDGTASSDAAWKLPNPVYFIL